MNALLLEAGWQPVDAGVDPFTSVHLTLWQSPVGRRHTETVALLLLQPVDAQPTSTAVFGNRTVGRPRIYASVAERRLAQCENKADQNARRTYLRRRAASQNHR